MYLLVILNVGGDFRMEWSWLCNLVRFCPMDLVDIFGCNNELRFVCIEEQSEFYKKWLKSLG